MKKLFSLVPFLLLFLFLSCFLSTKSYAQVSPTITTSPPSSTTPTTTNNGSDTVPVVQSQGSDTTSDSTSFSTCPPQFPPGELTGDTSNCTPTSNTITKNDPYGPYDPSNPTGTTDNPLSYITDYTRKVQVSFTGLTGDSKSYVLCFRLDKCLTGLAISYSQQQLTTTGVDKDLLKHFNTPGQTNNGNSGELDFSNFQITVCGRGDGDLYYGDECDPNNKHYFHAGHNYVITVYYLQNDSYIEVAQGGFYVNHGVPNTDLEPNKNINLKSGVHFKLNISEPILRFGGDGNNDYQVVLDGPDIDPNKAQQCGTVKQDGPNNPLTFTFPITKGQTDVNADSQQLINSGYILPGTYTVKINERINEGGAHTDACQGGHTYLQYTCNLSTDTSKSSCTKTIDPNGDDAGDLAKLLDTLVGGDQGVASIPCSNAQGIVSDPLKCTTFDTAIGNVSVDPIGFISSLFSIILSVAGFAALLIIIYSGYRLLISRGDKTIIQDARDRLTSAIIGLVFIVLSLVILTVITHDILHIPGFS